MTFVQDVDVSDRSAVALCSCGWRSSLIPHPDRGQAWSLALAHASTAHPGEVDHATSRNASWHR